MRLALLVVAAVVAPGCTLLAHGFPRDCDPGSYCDGLNARLGLDPASSCEVWWCDDDGNGGPRCVFGPPDRDDDGALACGAGPLDCDDTPATGGAVRPGADDACNGVDDDCDGAVDERELVPVRAVSTGDVDRVDRAALVPLDDGRFAWAQSVGSGGGGLFVQRGLVLRFDAASAPAAPDPLAWSFAAPTATPSEVTFVRGSPIVDPGAVPPWMVAAEGGFVDVAAAPLAGGRLLIAAIDADDALCSEGQVRFGIVPASAAPDGASEVQVLGGPVTGRLRSAIHVMADPTSRMLADGERFCTGPSGASRISLGLAAVPSGTLGSGVALWAAEPPAPLRRLCGGGPVALRALGVMVELGETTRGAELAWVSGLQAPGPDDGASTSIESAPIGTITGAGVAATTATASGLVFAAWPSGDEIVVVRFETLEAPPPYTASRDPEARYTGGAGSGMPALPAPVEIARFPAPAADHVAIASSRDESTLALAWQEGCDGGDLGSVWLRTLPRSGMDGSEPVMLDASGTLPSIAPARDVVRPGWPVAVLGGAVAPAPDGFAVTWTAAGTPRRGRVALALTDGRVVATSELDTTDAVDRVVVSTPVSGRPTAALWAADTVHAAALRCEP